MNQTTWLLALSVLLMLLTMLAYKDKWPFDRADHSNGQIRPVTAPSSSIAPKEESKQRLSIRITDGLVDRQSNDPATMVILLNVRVDGEVSEIKGWRLGLCHDGKKRVAYQQPIRRPLTYHCLASVNEQRPGTITDADPMPTHVPDKGWILFTVPAVAKEFDDYIFGATFTLTAVEANLKELALEKPAGEWLHRASIGD